MRVFGAPRALGIALRIAGLAQGGKRGLELLDESVAVLRSSPALLERAHSLAELGAALRRAGQRAAAREPLAEALDLAARCGARPLAARAREELRATGARPRREWRTGVEALTPSELRIVRLAAEGRSNREIAHELYVTLKTVEGHLSRAYAKLGIEGRGQLGRGPRRRKDQGVDPLANAPSTGRSFGRTPATEGGFHDDHRTRGIRARARPASTPTTSTRSRRCSRTTSSSRRRAGCAATERQSCVAFFGSWFGAFPDAHVDVHGLHVVDDVAVEEGTFTGTHDGVLHSPTGDVPPTGRPVRIGYIQVLRFRDGKHVSFKLMFDRLSMLEQLGLVPAPAATA